MKHVLSYGGGLNSSAAMVYLIEEKKPLDLILFANTGDEFLHTYESVEFYAKYATDNGYRFLTVDNLGNYEVNNMREFFMRKQLTPSRLRRDCTTKFKVSPIRKTIRSHFPKEKIVMYIGIDNGESHRIKDSNVKYITNSYPLIDAKLDREGCIQYLKERELPIPQKSGCYYCPFTTKPNWIKLMKEHPDLYEKAIELETNNRLYPKSVSLLHSLPLLEFRDKVTSIKNLDYFLFDQNEEKSKRKEKEERDVVSSCDVSASCFL